MKRKHLDMTQGHPARLLLTFSLPLMAGNVFQQLYTVVDTAIVGQGVGMDALAALGGVDWLNWLFLGIAQGFSQGFAVRMAQKFGEGDMQGLKRAIGISVWLSVLVAFVALVVAQLGLNVFMDMLQVKAALRPQAERYCRVIFLGIPAMIYYNFTASVLRAVGDSRTPLLAMVAAALSNIALDCVAVFALGWGVAGAAAATVMAQCIAGMLCTVQIVRSQQLRISKEHLIWDGYLANGLMRLGFPVAAQNVIIAVGGMVVQSVVNGFETSFIAGFTATNKLYGLLEIAAVSYGYAVTTYTGQNYGAMRCDRIRSGTRWAVVVSLLTSAVIAVLMLVFGRSITMLFISREDLQLAAAAGETAYRYLSVMALCLPVLYLLYAYRSALQGMGDTKVPLLSGIVEFVMRVGAALFIASIVWQEGIFYAEVLAWTGAAALLCGAYYHRERRLCMDLGNNGCA